MVVSYRRGIIPSIALMLLAISAGINVLQAQRIRALVSPVPGTPAAIGRMAVPVQGYSRSGEKREVTFKRGRPTVLYFFSPTCLWCERNWPNIQSLLSSSAAGRYDVVLVSASRELDQYLRSRNLTVDVLEGISENSRQHFGLSATPQTVVVSPEGIISHVWSGAYTARPKRQLEELFAISLPGLAGSVAGSYSK